MFIHAELSSRSRRGFTLIELLVSIAIIGLLIGIVLPAVQTARSAARATQCKNNLRQIGLATLLFHEMQGAFPPARLYPRPGDDDRLSCGGKEPSWLVRILPYIEQDNTFDEWDVYAEYAEQPNEAVERVQPLFVCPTRRTVAKALIPTSMVEQDVYYGCGCGPPLTVMIEKRGGAVGDYAGNHGDFTGGATGAPTDYWRGGNGTGIIISSRAICVEGAPVDWHDKVRTADVTDGLSNTFLAGEMHVPFGRLSETPENGAMYNGEDLAAFARIGGPGIPLARNMDDTSIPIRGFGSWHADVCHFVLADGSVRGVSNLIDTTVLGHLCHRSDGAAVE